MFGLFRKSSRGPIPEPEPAPVVGIPLHEVMAALAVVDTLAIDRRILRVEVVAEGRLTVVTGHVTGFLHADVHDLTLERRPGGWEVVQQHNFVS